MASKPAVMFIFGTRPEAIKMAPVISAMKADARMKPVVCVTAQHRQMLDQVLALFRIKPHHDLDIMRPGQDLFDVTTRALTSLRDVIRSRRPDAVLVQGDTTTTFAGALAAFYERVPVVHMEAGLRTDKKFEPFPEEINRRLTTQLADLHLPPTKSAMANLIRESVDKRRIVVTGNTVVDALLSVSERISSNARILSRLERQFPFLDAERKMVLITAHRRESFGRGFREICEAIAGVASRSPQVDFVYPVHLNPNVQAPVRSMLGGLGNVHLIEPVEYLPFVFLMMRSHVILTDSGGVQEEAPSLNKPVLVMRNVTERMEAIEAGAARLVGNKRAGIEKSLTELLENPAAYGKMARVKNPYGDGRASVRTIDAVARLLKA